MKSTLKNMVISLLAITFGAGLAMALVHQFTKGAIEASKGGKVNRMIGEVLPEFDNVPSEDTTTVEIDGLFITVYKGAKSGKTSGYAVETSTKVGYNGVIELMVGFRANGEIENIKVLSHNETPGLGSKIEEPNNPLLVSFTGKSPAELKMSVKKDGGDIDVITSSTITSRAYTDAVKRAYEAYLYVAKGVELGSGKGGSHFDKLLPNHTNNPEEDRVAVEFDGEGFMAYVGRVGSDIVGYAVEGSADGYGGVIELLVGFTVDGEVVGITVTQQSETPGFGASIADDQNMVELCFIGKKIDEMNLGHKKDGGDIDVISAATITTDAYVEAVESAYKAFLKIER